MFLAFDEPLLASCAAPEDLGTVHLKTPLKLRPACDIGNYEKLGVILFLSRLSQLSDHESAPGIQPSLRRPSPGKKPTRIVGLKKQDVGTLTVEGQVCSSYLSCQAFLLNIVGVSCRWPGDLRLRLSASLHRV